MERTSEFKNIPEQRLYANILFYLNNKMDSIIELGSIIYDFFTFLVISFFCFRILSEITSQ